MAKKPTTADLVAQHNALLAQYKEDKLNWEAMLDHERHERAEASRLFTGCQEINRVQTQRVTELTLKVEALEARIRAHDAAYTCTTVAPTTNGTAHKAPVP